MSAPGPEIERLAARLEECMLSDRFRIGRRLHGLGRGAGRRRLPREALQRIAEEIDASIAQRQRRAGSVPEVTWPEHLPIVARRQEIAEAVARHPVVVVCGETGSGKTTQIPKICLAMGRGVAGTIGHTQPRRIAARSVAARIAEELGGEVGRHVGYQVRFAEQGTRDCHVKVMTDGILLAETQSDPLLLHYDTIIIDEAHDRSLNVDFLLGYLHRLRARRGDLKIIITSATIDPGRFSDHFGAAPVVEVSGRVFPVEVRYRPLAGDDPDDPESELLAGVVKAVDEVAALGPGDVLVFLPGEREIRESAERLRKHHPPHTQILPLYARLSLEEQARVFQPHSGRRIILATNVAETALTVPGIRYVIDSGLARVGRYSARRKVQLLPIQPISQASAEQRKGRCGRVREGVCIRLYSQEDLDKRAPYTDAEILRSSLASVILRMKALSLGPVEEFPFMDRPRRAAIQDGYDTLRELGALDEKGAITEIGHRLADLPLDPRLGRMILAAEKEGALREVLVIAAALSAQDPRERPMEEREAADEAHGRFQHEESDFLSLLNIWEFWHEQRHHLSWNKLRLACRENHLSFVRMREWVDVHQQLKRLVTEAGMRFNAEPAAPQSIHRALLAGLLSNVALRSERFAYAGGGGKTVHIFPGSALFRRQPQWIVAAELVETTRLYARTVGRIQPQWLEEIGAHLVQKSWSNPRWDARGGHVIADERVTLFGLTIVDGRRVPYGPVDPRRARDIFIRHALVQGEYQSPGPFQEHNRHLVEEIEMLQAKSRRRDLLVDESVRYDFYDARVPADVWAVQGFERFREKIEAGKPRFLFMNRSDLMVQEPEAITAERFPDAIVMGGASFHLEYRLEPGDPEDGVTVIVPVEAVNQIDGQRLEWLVRGYLEEKVTALIRTLPKALRRSFVPAPDFAAACVDRMSFGAGSLRAQLGRTLEMLTGTTVPDDAWDHEAIPAHLRANLRVVDGAGETIARGRDLAEIRRAIGAEATHAFAAVAEERFRRDGISRWDFGDLPPEVDVAREGLALLGYPTLLDQGKSVGLRLSDAPEKAERGLREGLRRLVLLALPGEVESYLDTMPSIATLRLHWSALNLRSGFDGEVALLIADRAFLGDEALPRTAAAFDQCLSAGYSRVWHVAQDVLALAGAILEAHHGLALALDRTIPAAWAAAVDDIRAHVAFLLHDRFLTATPHRWLMEFPRYLAASRARFAKLAHGGHVRDARLQEQIQSRFEAYRARAREHREQSIVDPSLEEYRWMLEELRVSTFAQELGTAVPVSAKRLDRQWSAVR